MALKRPNPLSGAFKSEKTEEPPKVEAEAKTAGPSSLGKLGEEKTPTELPKDKDPKTAAGGPTKPTDGKGPTEPPKTGCSRRRSSNQNLAFRSYTAPPSTKKGRSVIGAPMRCEHTAVISWKINIFRKRM